MLIWATKTVFYQNNNEMPSGGEPILSCDGLWLRRFCKFGILYCQTTWQIDTNELDEECQWHSDGLSNLLGRDSKLFVLHGIMMYNVVYI